jgi:hypothetical protein
MLTLRNEQANDMSTPALNRMGRLLLAAFLNVASLAAPAVATANQSEMLAGLHEIPPFVCDRIDLVHGLLEHEPFAARACGVPFPASKEVPAEFEPLAGGAASTLSPVADANRQSGSARSDIRPAQTLRELHCSFPVAMAADTRSYRPARGRPVAAHA